MSKSVYTKDYKEIINRLKQARIDAGLSQQVVAGKLGKPQSYVSKIESGERRLDVAEIKKFAVVYKKDISFLPMRICLKISRRIRKATHLFGK